MSRGDAASQLTLSPSLALCLVASLPLPIIEQTSDEGDSMSTKSSGTFFRPSVKNGEESLVESQSIAFHRNYETIHSAERPLKLVVNQCSWDLGVGSLLPRPPVAFLENGEREREREREDSSCRLFRTFGRASRACRSSGSETFFSHKVGLLSLFKIISPFYQIAPFL